MRLVKVPRREAENARTRISALDALRKDVVIVEEGEHILIPLKEELDQDSAMRLGYEIVEGEPAPRSTNRPPFDQIVAALDLPNDLKRLLPRKWELLGDVLVLKISGALTSHRAEIARAYAQVLGANTVCNEVGVISGVHRTPKMEVLYGDRTETVHKENGILYRLDVTKVMFSSGNMDEKRRMASLDCRGETVVDMFAGIGYFALPLAVHARARRVVACEINPIAFGYLVDNIFLNSMEQVIQPFVGDNRELPGEAFADRVLMGYVGTTDLFLAKAFELVKPGGVIHYHETCPIDEYPERPLSHIRQAAEGRRFEVLRMGEVKSFAPAISHYVVDFQVTG